jgi:uncharacterized protein
MVRIEFDPAKNERNIRNRGIAFMLAKEFDFDTAVRVEDLRHDYGETRVVAYGYIGARLHVMCYKPVGKNHIRIISLRKANQRERASYAETARTIH